MIAKHLMSELKLRPPKEHNPARKDGACGTHLARAALQSGGSSPKDAQGKRHFKGLLEYIGTSENGNDLSCGNVVAVSGDDEETVGAAEGGDVAGALPGQGVDQRRGGRPFEASRQEMREAGFFVERLRESGVQERKRTSGGAAEEIDGRGDEELEGDHGGDRITGQAEDEFVAAASEDCGLARANRDGVEEEFRAEGFEDRFDEIVLAHRNATGENKNVVLEAEFDFCAEVVDAIESVAERDGLAASKTDLCGEGDAIAIADVKGTGRFGDGNNFVAGGEDGDEGLLVAKQIGGADLSGDGKFREAET
jgi:hypothetical protein